MTIHLPKEGELLAGRYRILSKIGEGGYGSVYKAHQEAMGRLVALKVLNPEIAERPGEVERFRREVFHASGLSHQNTITLHDFGESNGLFYIAMEYLEGMNLRTMLAQNKSIPPAEAIEITVQILRSLREAHRRSIIHRDLKPDNIFLCKKFHDDIFVKVLDFGLSKYAPGTENVEASITTEGTIFGTPQYMAPEQAYGEAVSSATDIYAVGLIFYEMLTGVCAFDGKSAKSILLKQVSAPLPPLPEHIRVPYAQKFLDIATAKNAEDRFVDATTALDWVKEQNRVSGSAQRPKINISESAMIDFGRPDLARPIPKRTSDAHQTLRSFESRIKNLPLIGREKELEEFKTWSNLALSGGGFGLLVGDLGLGKSKLFDVFANTLTNQNLLVFKGRFRQDSTPLETFREALMGIADTDIAPTPGEQTLPETLSLDLVPKLLEILSPSSNPTPKDKPRGDVSTLNNFVFIEEAIKEICSHQPVAILFEDLHYADPLSLDLIRHWREILSVSRYPILMFCTTRVGNHGYQPLEKGAFSKQIELQPMKKSDAFDLMGRLVPLNKASMEKIYTQSGGSPLFIIELLRSLSEDGGLSYKSEEGFWNIPSSQIAIPEELDGLLVRRVERLIANKKGENGELIRRFFQYAILLGVQFRTRDMRSLCKEMEDLELFSAFDDIVKTLTQSYFLVSCAIDHEPALAFRYEVLRQALMHAQDYKLPSAKEAHARIAEKKKTYFQDHAAQASEISSHYDHAGLTPDAFRWRMKSAQIHESHQDYQSALREFRQAEGMLNEELDPSGEKLLKIRLATGLCYQNFGDFGLAEFALRSAYLESQKVGDLVGSAQAGEQLAQVKILTSCYIAADDIFRSVQKLYQGFKNFSGVARCEIGLADISLFRGNYRGAQKRYKVTLEDAKKRKDTETILTCSIGLGRCAYGAGRLKEAIELFKKARTRAESLGNLSRVADIDIELGQSLIRVDGILKAEEQIRLALDVKRKLGDRLGVAQAHLVIGMALRRSTRLEEAEFHARRALAISERLAHLYIVSKAILLRSEIAWVRGDLKIAKEFGLEAEVIHEEIKDYHGLALTKSFLALYACESGGFKKARFLTQQSLEMSGKRGLGLYQAQFVLLHGLVHEREGNLEEALAHFGEALALAEWSDNHETASYAASCLAKNHIAVGDFSQLKEEVAIARGHADRIGNNLTTSFAISAEVITYALLEDEGSSISLKELIHLNQKHEGLHIPKRMFETAIAALTFRRDSKPGTAGVDQRERSQRTALLIADILDEMNESPLANDLRTKIHV